MVANRSATAQLLVHRVVELDAEPSAVWEALVDPASLERWFGGRLDIWPVEGGDVVFRGDNGERRRGVVETAEPACRLAFWWWPDSGRSRPPGTRVEFTIERSGRGSVLTLVEEEGEPAPLPPRPVGFRSARR